jgi:hypothetical protein
MAYIIKETQVAGQQSIFDISLILGECGGVASTYSVFGTPINVTINSVAGSIVSYTPNSGGSFGFSVSLLCAGDEVAVEADVIGQAASFQITVSEPSVIYNFPSCCNDCFNPVIVSDLYENDTYIPFSLDMEDGTRLATASGDEGKVLDGAGVIELSNPLVAGEQIQLSVVSSTCKAISSIVKVKRVSEDCQECEPSNRCHIRLLNVSVKSDGVNLVSISKLNVEAFGELRYRLDNGAWFSDWASIGSFSSLVNHTLGIKLVNNPACRIEYPFLAISYT